MTIELYHSESLTGYFPKYVPSSVTAATVKMFTTVDQYFT